MAYQISAAAVSGLTGTEGISVEKKSISPIRKQRFLLPAVSTGVLETQPALEGEIMTRFQTVVHSAAANSPGGGRGRFSTKRTSGDI